MQPSSTNRIVTAATADDTAVREGIADGIWTTMARSDTSPKSPDPDRHRAGSNHAEPGERHRGIAGAVGFRHTRDGLETAVVCVSMTACKELAGYNPADDVDLYEYYLADEWQGMG
jgi:hypothetical protein